MAVGPQANYVEYVLPLSGGDIAHIRAPNPLTPKAFKLLVTVIAALDPKDSDPKCEDKAKPFLATETASIKG